jgi:hypothetical protein
VRVRDPTDAGATAMRRPTLELNSTLATSLRCWPLSWTLESVVALRRPPQVEMQITSLSCGGSGGVTPPPPPEAPPAQTDSDAKVTARGTVLSRHRRPAGAVPLSLKRAFPLSPACGVSCRARAERAALRTRPSDSPRDDFFDVVPLVPPPRCGKSAADSAGHLSAASIATPTAAEAGLEPPLDYHAPAAPASGGGGFSRSHVTANR